MSILFWFGFLTIIFGLLALDLGVFHKQDAEPSAREALGWTFVWVLVAVAFAGFIYGAYDRHWFGIGLDGTGAVIASGREAALQYLTGYLIEYTLSMDNIFVIALIFGFFHVPPRYQHRVLFWGILGAIVMRGAMIIAGAALVARFTWIIYVFGGFLVLTGLKMLVAKTEDVDLNQNVLVRFTRRLVPVTERFHGQHFLVRAGSQAGREPAVPGAEILPDRMIESARPGALLATPLLLALVMVEVTDVIFAVDSIPAIFAITTDPFIVLTSNLFAILGLRAMYFMLAGMADRFSLLKYGLALVLVFIGTKMLLIDLYPIPVPFSLGVVAVIIATSIVLSLRRDARQRAGEAVRQN